MATHTRYFRWDDPSAPSLTGEAGSGIALLKALLVGDSGGVAYGTGDNEKLAAGWTLEYEDTVNHVAVFRNSLAAGGTGRYLRVDDGASGTAGAREMLFRAYRTMSDANTGTGPTPTTTDEADGLVIRKSNALTSDARSWICAADERTAYLGIEANTSPTSNDNGLYYAGDFTSEVPGDEFAFGVAGRDGQNSTSAAESWLTLNGTITTINGSSELYLMSDYALGDDAVRAAIPSIMGVAYPGAAQISTLPNPAPGSGELYFAETWIVESGTLRGRFRGMYAPLNDLSSDAIGTIYADVRGLPSDAELALFRANISGNLTGGMAIETVRSWE